jgi:hypothetical protein
MIDNRIEFLKTIQANFQVAELNEKENKPSVWKDITEVSSDKIRFREQLNKELILELDYPTEAENIRLFEEILKPILEQKQISYEAWQTHSKSLHLNFFFDKEIDNNDRYSWLCETFGKTNIDLAIEKGQVDKAFFTKDRQLIAMEFQPHYKSKQEKTLYAFTPKKINEFKIETKTILQGPKERRVQINYGEILANPEATEQERVSCVMQIFNKHKTWKANELLDYVALHNKWSDYNPETTRKKIEEFILPKYQDKPNPLAKKEEGKIELKEVPTKEKVDLTKLIQCFENTHSHLPAYKLIETELGLQGNEYYSIKKYLNYYVESLRQPTISFHVGTEPFDNRTHFATMIDPGHGKGKIKAVIKTRKDTAEINGGRTHIEQLIGKKIKQGRGKNQVEIENLGYFGSKGLVMDESQTLLCEEQSHLSSIMVEIRKACDPFGYNITEKKQVDNLEALKYPPETRFCFLTHPVPLPALFFDLGTYRRMFCFQIKKNEKIGKKLANLNFFKQNKENVLKEYINTPGFSVKTMNFEEEQIIEVLEWVDVWRAFTLNHNNQRIKTLALNSFFSVPLYFFRLTSIFASLNGELTPTKKTICLACRDCIQFLLETFQIYANKSQINLSRSIWETEDADIAALLEWLWFNKSLTDKTEMMIEHVQSKIQDIWGFYSDRQAIRIYSKLKDKGYLKDYHAKGVSKCWLAFEPRIDGNISLDDYPKIDLISFIKKKLDDLGDISTPISCFVESTKSGEKNSISSTYNPNGPSSSHLSIDDNNLSPLSSKDFELIDGELPSKICSECRKDGPVVAIRQGEYFCEGCFEKLSKQ